MPHFWAKSVSVVVVDIVNTSIEILENLYVGDVSSRSLAKNLVNVLLIDDSTAFRALGLGAEFRTEIVNVDLAVAELLH